MSTNPLKTMSENKYSVIVFDLGNVLIPFDHGLWVRKFNLVEEGLGDSHYKSYIDNYSVHRNFESGLISEEEFIEINLRWLKNKVKKEKFVYIFSKIFSFNNNVIDLLPVLKEKYKLVLLSNTNSLHKNYGWGEYSFIKHFDKLILSHEVGAVKPDSMIYKEAEDFSNEPAENHIFIDDILEYVDAAKKRKWDGIQFTNYEELVKEFKKRKIL